MKKKANTFWERHKLLPIIILLVTLWRPVQIYAQQGTVKTNGITIAYESMGSTKNEAILLIGGTGMQLTAWPDDFCRQLADKGYRVIRFDNRDAGFSTKFDAAGQPDWQSIIDSLMKGRPSPVAYTVDDMAKDAVALLDALHIKAAHIVGISEGAIIAQVIASHYPEHTRSLTSMMGTTGNPALPRMKPEVQAIILTNPEPPANDTTAIVERQVKIFRALGSPGYPTDEKTLRKMVLLETKRCYYPAGMSRQGAAALVAGDRRKDLKMIKAPTVVVHGEDDPIVPVEAGKDVAATIPNAELRIIPGLGHDMPGQLIKTFVDAVMAAAGRSGRGEL